MSLNYRYKLITQTCFLLAALLFSGCFESTSIEDKNYTIRYDVYIPSRDLDSMEIEMSLHDWEYGDTIRMLAPPVYADNPVAKPTGNNFSGLRITGSSGSSISYNTDSVKVGAYNSLSIAFSSDQLPVKISYRVKFQYVDTQLAVFPFINEFSGYLNGGYLFMVPYHNPETVRIWRTPFDIQVDYHPGPEVSEVFYGDPLQTEFRNPYELMFSINALGGRLMGSGNGGGQSYRFINLAPHDTISKAKVDTMMDDFNIILDDLTGIFGTIENNPITVILGINKTGGLEGMYAFSINENMIRDVFNIILAHEMIHSWVGVRTGDYDDPWWKEGTANYLGYLVAVRTGLISMEYFDSEMLKLIPDSLEEMRYRLSDIYVRENLFSEKGMMYNLVYVKGAQVCMLLDFRIRVASGNSRGLDGIIGELVKKFDGSAFSRQDYINIIRDLSGANVDNIFRDYVDQPGVIPLDILENARNGLMSLGAFTKTSPITATVIQKSPEKFENHNNIRLKY